MKLNQRDQRDQIAFIRWIAALLICVFGSTDIISLVHHASVDHSVCLDHGEVIHTDEESSHGAAFAQEGLALQGAAPLGPAHIHDTCFLFSSTRDEVGLTATYVLVGFGLDLSTELEPTLGFTFDHKPQIPIFRLAPKQSPPTPLV